MTHAAPHTVLTASAPANGVVAAYGVIASVIDSAETGGVGPVWIKIAPLGLNMGRDGTGPYDFGDPAKAAAIVAATKVYHGGTDAVIDYDHQSDIGVPQGGTAIAAGWISDWQVRDDGIYGLVTWTASAAAQLADRQYRYLSPTFSYAPASGGRVGLILRAGLTNSPKFQMPALAAVGASFPISEEVETMTIPKGLLTALGLPDAADEATAIATAKTLHETATAAATALGTIGVAVGLASTASHGDIAIAATTKLTEAAKAGTPDPAKYVPMEAFLEMSKALAAAGVAGKTNEIDTLAGALKAAGKLPPALEGWFKGYAAADLPGAKAWAAAAPVLVPPGNGGGAGGVVPPGTGDGLTAEEKAICAVTGVNEADYIKAKGV